jgi:hypothetical protein
VCAGICLKTTSGEELTNLDPEAVLNGTEVSHEILGQVALLKRMLTRMVLEKTNEFPNKASVGAGASPSVLMPTRLRLASMRMTETLHWSNWGT